MSFNTCCRGFLIAACGLFIALPARTDQVVPPLAIVLPEDGAVVGTQLAVVLQTPGDMNKLTMSAPVVGVHLHIAVDDTVLMPLQQQLIRLGGGRYLYLFDLPVKPGAHRLSVFWADAAHDTIASSVRSIGIRVTPDPAP